MVCQPCQGARHEGCPGGTWCDCQHQQRALPGPVLLHAGGAARDPHATGLVHEPLGYVLDGDGWWHEAREATHDGWWVTGCNRRLLADKSLHGDPGANMCLCACEALARSPA